MTTGMNSAPLDRLMVFTGNANPRLAQDVAKHLNLPIGRAIVGKFSDGEVLVELIENVRGKSSGQVVAHMLASVGVARVLMKDVDVAPIQGFFHLPVHNM